MHHIAGMRGCLAVLLRQLAAAAASGSIHGCHVESMDV